MKECFAITTYCDTEKKIKVLNKTIDNLKQYNMDIIIHAHYPLSSDIQSKVNSYFYSSNNPVLKNRWSYWNHYVDNYNFEVKMYDYSYTVFKAWEEIIRMLYHYDKIHIINYDSNITPDIFNLSKNNKSIFLKNDRENTVLLTYFSLTKNIFDYFSSNITLENYYKLHYEKKIIEETIPTFLDDRFEIISDYDINKLMENDVNISWFNWDKLLKISDFKLFIGAFDESSGVYIFDVKTKLNVKIELNDKSYNYIIDKSRFINFNIKFKDIKKLKIYIDDKKVDDKFIEQFFYVDAKIWDK